MKFFKKPTSLSNPSGDFSSQELIDILNKKDSNLTWQDFDCLFQGGLPAGTYEEVRYYIPLAMSYINKKDDNSGYFLEHFAHWVDLNCNNLKKDDLLVCVHSSLLKCFETLVCEFELVENDDHHLYPVHSFLVTEIFQLFLFLSKSHNEFDLATCFNFLRIDMNYAKAAWLVYLISCSPFQLNKTESQILLLLENAQTIIIEHICNINDENVFKFWNDKI